MEGRKRRKMKRDPPADFAIPIPAYFDAEYPIIPCAAILPLIDETTTMDPRPRLRVDSGCR